MAVFDSLPCGGAFVDPEGIVRLANRHLEVQLARPRAMLVGAPAREVLAGDEGARAVSVVEAAQAGDSSSADVSWQHPDGRRVQVTLRAHPRLDSRGRHEGVVITATDHRGAAETELLQLHQELEAVQRVARIGSYRTDLVKGTWTASDGFCQLFGFEPGGVYTTEEFQALVHPQDFDRVMTEFGACIAERRPFDIEYRCLRRGTGELIHVRSTSQIFYDPDGNAVRIAGIKQDITAQRETERQVAALQRLESVGRLAGGVAHDFNNLLTAIMGVTELGQLRTAPDDRNQRTFDQILATCTRAARLTNQLLAFTSRQVVEDTVISPAQVIDDTARMIRTVMGDAVTVTIRHDDPRWRVRMGATGLEQVIMNLAINARHAMDGSGTLLVETRNVVSGGAGRPIIGPSLDAGEYVAIQVTDTGHGMDADTQARIFEPFFTTKEVGEGTGLGLATCFGIVKQVGGTFEVHSEPGRGSSFFVYLPRVFDPLTEAPTERIGPAPAGTERLLLVEDNPAVMEPLREALEATGYTVLTARDGLAALELHRGLEQPVDALVTDVVMPGMTGPELVVALRQRQPGLPVLIISGFPNESLGELTPLPSRTGVLQKPFAPGALGRELRRLLDDWEA